MLDDQNVDITFDVLQKMMLNDRNVDILRDLVQKKRTVTVSIAGPNGQTCWSDKHDVYTSYIYASCIYDIHDVYT